MHCIRKYLGKAIKSPPKSQDLYDKNDLDASCDDLPTDSEYFSDDYLKDPFNEYIIKMLNMIRELIIFCFIFMVYAAITNDPPKVTNGPAAYPFFPKNSLVKDFYRGQIMTAIEYARTNDMSFIMFYAPWDAESQAARDDFIAASEYLKEYVVFAAVNCWQPGSECRIHYNKVYRWPVLIAYPTYGTGIQYRGPISAPHIIRFLQNLMNPIKRIASDSVLDFEEVFLVAELNTLPKSLEYSVYYSTALKYLEVDPLAKTSFYVKPVKHTVNKITLYLWNQVRILEIEGDWEIETILKWIIKSIETPSSWVVPSGAKSLLLASHLVPGPSLILFTPKNPLQDANDYYMMLQEISQEYKNCDNWGLHFDMKSKRLKNLVDHQNLLKNCKIKDRVRKFKKSTPVTINFAFSNSSSNLYYLSDKLNVDCIPINTERKIPNHCYTRNYISQHRRNRGTSWQQSFDSKSVQNIRKLFQNEKCRKFLTAQKIQPAIFEAKSVQNDEKIDVSSLGCANQTLDFIAMDSILHYNFAERLGIDLFQSRDKSAVVIINEKMETHYILEGPITSQNLRKFIRKFADNTLPRSFNSSVDVPMKNSPSSYSFKDFTFTSKPFVHVEELNSNSFLQKVMRNNQAVVVMYYSKQCSYCNGISYTFLTLARKLSFVDNLQFTRIDGDTNILPWEYTMEEFPTILLFPSHRKEETRVFPSELPITVPNLLGFILANLESPLKLHSMYSICLQTQNELDRLACLSTARNETIALIETTLRSWRKSNNRQRQLLLHNLAQLRQLQFLFNHTPNDFKLIDSYIKKLNTKLTEDYSVNSSKAAKDEL